MTTSDTPFADTIGTTRPPLRVNPAVVVGLGDFGGAALRILADRLRPNHPVLFEKTGWLWLTVAGWQANVFPDPPPDPAAEHVPPVSVAPEPLARALDGATSQAAVTALGQAGYDVGATLDTVIVARVDDPFTQGALWPLLDLLRAQPPLRANRVTLVLACDSRRFAGPSAPALAKFFGALAERLTADRTDPTPGATAWCYLCDALDVDSRLLGSEGGIKEVVGAQVELAGGFLALLLGSGTRRDSAYERTALPELAHDISAPPDAALVSSFGLGAYTLPVEQIAALARDRLALRLHPVAFPGKASVADREPAWSARERFLAAADLSPKGLRDRLQRGPDGAPIRFDTSPPDLMGLDPEARLQALARWRNGLEERWADESMSPPGRIAHNADALLDEWSKEMQREVDGLIKSDPRGLYRALAFLNELPQAVEEAQVQLMADDSDYLHTTIPSADESFRQLGDQVTKKKPRRETLILAGAVYIPLIILSLWMRPSLLGIWIGLWLGTTITVLTIRPRRYRQQLKERQSEFVTAVQLKFEMGQTRETRAKRRVLLERLSQAVREERQALLAWQETISEVPAILAEAELPPLQSACGERHLCGPADYPSPVDDYEDGEIADIAAHYLDQTTRPHWREGDAKAIVAWLRAGAERALAGWRGTITVAGWRKRQPSQAIAELATSVRPQWPLARDERRQLTLNLIGLPGRDDASLPRQDDLGPTLAVSTFDPTRLSYAPTYHGLRLKKLAATRALWATPVEPEHLPAQDTIHKTFVWRYTPSGEAQEHQINLVLSRPRYQAFRAEPRPPRGEWGRLVTALAPELDALADALSALHRQRDWSPLERASNVLAFTQECITYDTDLRTAPAGEWPRYPLETLADGVGDCEDAVILAAAILKRLGYDVALLYYPHHCAMGVAGAEELPGIFVEDPQTGVKYFYGETTAEGWSLGQVPEKYREPSLEDIEVVRMMVE